MQMDTSGLRKIPSRYFAIGAKNNLAVMYTCTIKIVPGNLDYNM